MKEMHPILSEEIYRIACEGIRNAFMHSEGSHIDVEIRYAEDFVLRVSDNGKGVPQEFTDGGKQGHFGLGGMRERATRIGGKFSLTTSATSGTQITLRIPGIIVFHKTGLTPANGPARLRSLWQRILRKNDEN